MFKLLYNRVQIFIQMVKNLERIQRAQFAKSRTY